MVRLKKISSLSYEVFSGAKSIFSNSKGNIFWMNLYQLINILASILISVAFARLTTQDLYGQYIFVISIVSFLSLVSMPGVRTTIFRSVSQGNENFYKNATKFSFLWSLLGIPLLLLTGLYFYVKGQSIVGLSIISASLFFPFMYSLQNWKNLFKAKEDFKQFVLYETSISITKAVLIISLLVLRPRNLFLILLVYFFSTAVLNTYFFIRSLEKVNIDGKEIKWKTESYEYTLLNLTSYTFSKIDRVLIGLFLPFNQVAIYNIAAKVADTIFKFIKSSIEAVLPKFFQDDHSFSDFYPIFALLFLIPVVLYPLVEYPIILLYTSKYSESVFYARLYLFAVPFYFMSYVSSQALIKRSLSTEVNKSRIISIIGFVVASLILIPNIGILGGIIASLAYYPFQTVLCMYYLNKNNYL